MQIFRTVLAKYPPVYVLLGLLLMCTVFYRPELSSARESRPPASPAVARLATASTNFGLKLYARLNQNKDTRNIFFSPASVASCLSMVINGAQGQTKEEMARVLEFNQLSLQDLNQAYAEWKNSWGTPDPKVELEVANSIWSRRGITFRSEFMETNKRFYSAEVRDLDFNDPAALNIINSWVKNKTRGKIVKIIDQINAESVLFLINAIYFKGKWTAEFDAAKTKEDDFTTGTGRVQRLPMMRQRGSFLYQQQPEFQAINMPYGNRRLGMYVFLPAREIGLGKFQQMLTAKNWAEWTGGFRETEGEIVMPRFKVEYDITLNDALKSLGMPTAFDPNLADLSGMIQHSRNAYISQVKHKAFAEVNEEGTEAAAVTSSEISIVSMPIPTKPFQMIVNRPFFFAIRDHYTGTILFMGSVIEPENG